MMARKASASARRSSSVIMMKLSSRGGDSGDSKSSGDSSDGINSGDPKSSGSGSTGVTSNGSPSAGPPKVSANVASAHGLFAPVTFPRTLQGCRLVVLSFHVSFFIPFLFVFIKCTFLYYHTLPRKSSLAAHTTVPAPRRLFPGWAFYHAVLTACQHAAILVL